MGGHEPLVNLESAIGGRDQRGSGSASWGRYLRVSSLSCFPPVTMAGGLNTSRGNAAGLGGLVLQSAPDRVGEGRNTTPVMAPTAHRLSCCCGNPGLAAGPAVIGLCRFPWLMGAVTGQDRHRPRTIPLDDRKNTPHRCVLSPFRHRPYPGSMPCPIRSEPVSKFTLAFRLTRGLGFGGRSPPPGAPSLAP